MYYTSYNERNLLSRAITSDVPGLATPINDEALFISFAYFVHIIEPKLVVESGSTSCTCIENGQVLGRGFKEALVIKVKNSSHNSRPSCAFPQIDAGHY